MIETKRSLLKNLPRKTGIYLMKNASGRPLYIGKAKDIRSRTTSYFNARGDGRPYLDHLIKELESIDFIVTKDEREALILENSLIKTYKPKFNFRLKDDKSYSFLTLTTKDKFPKLVTTRRVKEDGNLYYGPFAYGGALKQTKRLINLLFGIRDCSDVKFARHQQRPCLSYDLNLCLGPCAGKVSEDTYLDSVNRAKTLLNGDKKTLIRILKKDMDKAAREERFEQAIGLRDKIKLLAKDLEVAKVLSSSLDDRDVIALHKSSDVCAVVALFFRFGAIAGSQEYLFNDLYQDEKEVMQQFISRFYEGGRYIPKEVLINVRIDGAETYREWLCEKAGKKVSVIVPRHGAKRRLISLAEKNAEESIRRRSEARTNNLAILETLKSSLRLKNVPKSIECFDVSNIQSDSVVASLVRFSDGEPDKSRYRKYRIKTVSGQDDYASMSEVLSRRFKRTSQDGWDKPDLIMIDGGKGQLSSAAKAIKAQGHLEGIDLISIAKGRKRGEIDKIYVHGGKAPFLLSGDKGALYLLMRIRDEAHRFAITYHRQRRAKTFTASGLDNVAGIGKKRRTLLLNHFGSLNKIRSATFEDISSLPGMNAKVASEIKKLFH